jgi:hypothetical protein
MTLAHHVSPATRASATCRLIGLGLLLGSAHPHAAVARAEPTADAYSLGLESQLLVRVYRARGTLLSSLSHDHVIRAPATGMTLHFDASQPQACHASLRIGVSTLVVDEPRVRRRLGMSEAPDADDRATIRENMLAEDQLDAARHPEVQIRVRSCRRTPAPGKYGARIELEIRGETHHADATFEARGDELVSRGQLRLGHRQLGIEPYSAFLGAVKNADPIDLSWSLRARRGPPAR